MPSPTLESTLRFLNELSLNNNKPWFDAHRAQFDVARAAFYQLIDTVIDEFRAPDNLQALTAKDCTARIFRDIRFSRDKSPYKTNLSAYIAVGGLRSGRQGYYVSVGAQGESMAAGGLHDPSPEQLLRFREAIDHDSAPLKAILTAPAFVSAFGALDGERLKTVPRGFDPAHPDIALLQLKGATAIQRFSDAEVTAPDFPARVIASCRAMRPFLNYLDDILAGES